LFVGDCLGNQETICIINEAYYKMGHMGEGALRRFLNHLIISTTGKFQNCISCMKWKAKNQAISKVATTPAKYPGERLGIDVSGPLCYQWEEKNIG
jgi:hypothetical protein